MMSKYQMIQATNKNIGAVAAGALLPLGVITRKISDGCNCGQTFQLQTTGADTVAIGEKGYYRIVYSASLEAGAAGAVGVTLLVGGVEAYSVQATAAENGYVNLTLPYVVRAFANCGSLPTNLPLNVQLRLDTTAVTAGTGNLIVEKMC